MINIRAAGTHQKPKKVLENEELDADLMDGIAERFLIRLSV
jgi:hypothetical protein